MKGTITPFASWFILYNKYTQQAVSSRVFCVFFLHTFTKWNRSVPFQTIWSSGIVSLKKAIAQLAILNFLLRLDRFCFLLEPGTVLRDEFWSSFLPNLVITGKRSNRVPRYKPALGSVKMGSFGGQALVLPGRWFSRQPLTKPCQTIPEVVALKACTHSPPPPPPIVAGLGNFNSTQHRPILICYEPIHMGE